ncbi:S-adenosyl-L-methionine-dependent methyltransferase [Mycena polygramma]|nr:S-adenosyl-L-methionine-dependent methyltransferase [Mycena polygramma]
MATLTSAAAAPDRVRLRELITDDPHSWDQAWNQNITPWEAGGIQPPLREVTQSGEVAFPRSGRAFVPGCGSRLIFLQLPSKMRQSTAISPIFVESLLTIHRNIPEGLNTRFELHDFFTFTVPDKEKFDLIYDYTFFVAIPPSRRNEWGAQMNSLIKPDGYLITLVFPLEPESDVGPPYFVSPEHYLAPLGAGWEKVVDRVPTVSSPTHVGKEHLVAWKKL